MATLSADDLLKVVKDITNDTVSIRWRNKVIKVRRLLTHNEEVELIRNIMDCCTVEDNDSIVFVPELFDISTKANIISAYSNIELPMDLEKQHMILYGTDLYNCILSAISAEQINAINIVLNYYSGIRG